MGVHMSDYIEEMDEHHQMEAEEGEEGEEEEREEAEEGEEGEKEEREEAEEGEEGEEEEREEAEEGEEGEEEDREEAEERVPLREEVGVEKGGTTPMDVGGNAERAPSPPRAAQAMATPRSSAYTMLADEVRNIKAEMKDLRAEVSDVCSEMSTIEWNVDLLLTHFGIVAPAPEGPPPTVHPSKDSEPTIMMDELTAEHAPTQAEPPMSSSPKDPHTSS